MAYRAYLVRHMGLTAPGKERQVNTPGTGTEKTSALGDRAAYRMFFDALTWEDIPAGSRACLYFDAEGAAPPSAADRFSRVRWITRTGDYRNCGIIDFEPGCPVTYQPPVLRRFVLGRKNMGVRARVYCDRADAHLAWEALASIGLQAYPIWWIATLDGTQGRTPESLAAELADKWHAPIPAASLWGHQWFSGATVDESDLFSLDW